LAPAALLEAAAAGTLPEWARVNNQRYAHAERVALLLGEWAAALELSPEERTRWKAAGYLHDALRDAPPAELRPLVPPAFAHLAGPALHGPAAATMLRQDGVDDESLLRAITCHTIGHPEFDELGRALYIADYIEPGRKYTPARLAEMRARMPRERAAVLLDVLNARMARQLSEGRPIRAETAAFWNVVHGAHDPGHDAGPV
jgi:HD superfamily phosphohydrolase YqeK